MWQLKNKIKAMEELPADVQQCALDSTDKDIPEWHKCELDWCITHFEEQYAKAEDFWEVIQSIKEIMPLNKLE